MGDDFATYSPEYNSAAHHAWRIGRLVQAYQNAVMSTENKTDDLQVLDLFDQEINPYMTDQECKDADELRKKCSGNPVYIRDYFIFLNRLAHTKGIMQKYVQKTLGVESDD